MNDYHKCNKCGTEWNADIEVCPTCPPKSTIKDKLLKPFRVVKGLIDLFLYIKRGY